jgi:nicotinate-nucleotide adenylyltransferase
VKYCIFGGSFDPPHEGHLYLARSAMETFALNLMIWLPTPEPPHKEKPETAFHHRLAMARLAAQGLANQTASDVEEQLPRPNYSLNAIRALKTEYGIGHQWYFLMGADNWAIFPAWHHHEEILREVTLIVFPRQGFPLAAFPPEVLRLDLPEFPIASRSIRETLAKPGGIDSAQVPPGVLGYIQAHGLYGQKVRRPM